MRDTPADLVDDGNRRGIWSLRDRNVNRAFVVEQRVTRKNVGGIRDGADVSKINIRS